ncbi:MAG: hypothetical protein M3P51_11605 [Chloroflexota bacterium]|nr:hypothetical protein [Chloroflexota bacterium]
MARRLEDCLNDTLLSAVWAHTLVFEAVRDHSVGDVDEALRSLLPYINRVHPRKRLSPLARASQEGGRLWLLDIPEGKDTAETIIYAALSPPEKGNRFVESVLFGEGAVLPMLDLVAHKAYHIIPKYRSRNIKDRYEDSIVALQRRANELLMDLTRHGAGIDKLDDATKRYGILAVATSYLNGSRIEIQQQLHNYVRFVSSIGDNDVLAYHRRHMETVAKELDLMVGEARDTMQLADTATRMAQVEVDRQQLEVEKAQERRTQRWQIWVGALAVILAVPQLIDSGAAAELLPRVAPWFGWTSYPPEKYSQVDRLIFRLITTALIVLPVGLFGLVRWWRYTQSQGRDRRTAPAEMTPVQSEGESSSTTRSNS